MAEQTAEPTSATRWPAGELETVDACPACGSSAAAGIVSGLSDRAFGVAPGEWTSVRCGGCGSRYLDPRPTAEAIGQAYDGYYTHSATSSESQAPLGLTDRLRRGYLNARLGYELAEAHGAGAVVGLLAPGKAAWFRRVVAHLRMPGEGSARLLDVGCGSGLLVERMAALGWDAEGIDVDPAAVATARERGLRATACSADQLLLERGPGSFDAIVIEHVIEHVHDPATTLSSMRALLRPGGQLVVITPNADSAGRRAYGENWIGLDPPRHLCVFSARGLRGALENAGMQSISRLRSAPTAAATVRHSEAIRDGVMPFGSDQPRGGQLVRAKAATALERLRPALSEELVFSARSPGGV